MLCLLMVCSDSPSTDGRLPPYNTPDFTPIFLADAQEADQKIKHTIESIGKLTAAFRR